MASGHSVLPEGPVITLLDCLLSLFILKITSLVGGKEVTKLTL